MYRKVIEKKFLITKKNRKSTFQKVKQIEKVMKSDWKWWELKKS